MKDVVGTRIGFDYVRLPGYRRSFDFDATMSEEKQRTRESEIREETSQSDAQTSTHNSNEGEEFVALSHEVSLEQWLRRNLTSDSAVRKMGAGIVKGIVEVFVSLLLARAAVWFVTFLFGPVPSDLFSALPGNLTLAGVFFFIFYIGGIKDVLGPN